MKIWLWCVLLSVAQVVCASQPDPDMLANIAALRARAGTQGGMAVKAQLWLDFAQEEFIELDDTGVADDALARATQLIDWIEKKQAEGVAQPELIRSVRPVREDWWQRLAQLPHQSCAVMDRARAEVQLIWAGHEQPELGVRHASRHLDDAEQALQHGENCHDELPPPAPIAVPMMPVAPPVMENMPNVVHFATDSAVISAESAAVLQRVMAVLQAYPPLKLVLGGHTDGRGNAGYNLKLSQRRVQAVRQHLIQLGLPTERLVVEAFGMRLSKANDLAQRAHERRVELTLLNPQVNVRSETQTRDLQK